MEGRQAAEQLKRALRALAKGVVLIACRSAEGERFVMPATAVVPVSMDPPSMLICVNRTVSAYPALFEGANFSVSILGEHHRPIAEFCTGSVNRSKRFSLGAWHADDDGTPYLGDALAAVICEQTERISCGTHDVIFGRVSRVKVNGVDERT